MLSPAPQGQSEMLKRKTSNNAALIWAMSYETT
jgi:hypothetical protein